jgi:hypothetical protein
MGVTFNNTEDVHVYGRLGLNGGTNSGTITVEGSTSSFPSLGSSIGFGSQPFLNTGKIVFNGNSGVNVTSLVNSAASQIKLRWGYSRLDQIRYKEQILQPFRLEL